MAMATARRTALPDGTTIRLIAAPEFIATKLVEVIIAVVDGRSELFEELNTGRGLG
ncbi:MAG: hypothetical protein IPF53_07780 [Blastocatellia bacterium]|jgi:uncharacterized protein (DUF779 family)|nr:hypothetical protein [Blastocatellia bacterium]